MNQRLWTQEETRKTRLPYQIVEVIPRVEVTLAAEAVVVTGVAGVEKVEEGLAGQKGDPE